MKNLLFIVTIFLLASCSTMYKSGQTPDDLYYAKGKVALENENRYEKLDNVYDERQIRMAAYDYRWRNLDYTYDYDYRYNPYTYGYNYGYYYNPYYCSYPVYGQSSVFINPKNTTIRTANLASYNNSYSTYNNTKTGNNQRTIVVRGYNTRNTQTNTNNSTRYDTRTYNENRSYTPSNNTYSPSSSGSGSSTPASSGTPVQRPARGQ